MKHYIIMVLFLGTFLSCENHFYVENYSFADGWLKSQFLDFEIEVEEPKKDYEIQFIVRNNNDYPYRNIILFTDFEGSRDTLSYELATKEGRWIGRGFGAEKELKLSFKKNYHFKDKGTKSLKVVQAMRKDTLYGITDFSVIINTKD